MRPHSQKSNRTVLPKHHFQTKLRHRNKNNHFLHHNATISTDLHLQKQRPTNTRHLHTECTANEEHFQQTASKLSERNFSHHHPAHCLCQECQCGRHLCKMHVIKPDLTKKTIYQHSFYPQKATPPLVLHAKEYDRLKGPHLEMNSTYLHGYTGRNGDELQRPKPQDLLHSEGPGAELTSYGVEYPGHRGKNQYVKPTDRHTRGHIPLRCKSTYSGAFASKSLKKDDYKYIPDQLKTGSYWLGTSTYSNFYAEPNPEYMAKQVKVVEKKEQNPADRLRFKTTYKNEFNRKSSSVCPAKIYLQTRGKGSFDESKANFTQNSDFKAISKNFQAISTSKHSFI